MANNDNLFPFLNKVEGLEDTYGYLTLPDVTVNQDNVHYFMRKYHLNREDAEAAAFRSNLLFVAETGHTETLPEGYTVYEVPLSGGPVATGYGGLKWVGPTRIIYGPDGQEVVRYDPKDYITYNTLDPADNFLNDLIFDAATLGRYGAVKGAFSTARNLATSDLYNSAVKGVSNVGKYMSPGPYVNRLATGVFRTSPGTARIWANAADAATAAGFAGYGLGKFAQDPSPETGALAVLYSMPMWGPGKAAVGMGKSYFNTAIRPNVGIGVYETPNGRVFGGRFGNYAGGVRLDAPTPANRIGIANINTPGSPVTGGRIVSNEDITIGDLMRLENGRIGYVSKVGENGVKVTDLNGNSFNISKDSARSIKLDNPEIPKGSVVEKISTDGDGNVTVREYTFTGKRDRFGGAELQDNRGANFPVSYDDLYSSGDFNITSSINDVLLNPGEEFAANFGNALKQVFGRENLNKLRLSISSGLSRLRGVGRSQGLATDEVFDTTQEPTVLEPIEQATNEWGVDPNYVESGTVEPQTQIYQIQTLEPIIVSLEAGTPPPIPATPEVTPPPLPRQSVTPVTHEPQMVITANEPVRVINKPTVAGSLANTPNYPRYHFNGKNYMKINETPEGDPVLVEYSHEAIGPKKGVNTETTIEKNTFKEQAIPIDENGIPETKLGDYYVDSEGVTHVLNTKNSDGTVGVLNTKTGEIEPTNALDFVKTRMKSTSNPQNNNAATNATPASETPASGEAAALEGNNPNTNTTDKLLQAGIFKEGVQFGGNNSNTHNWVAKIRKLRSPVYGRIWIGDTPYRVEGDSNGVLLLRDPRSTRVFSATMADLLGGKETVEVVQTGTTYFSKGPSASSKVTINGDEVYYPGTKFKDFGIRTGSRSPYRQPNFREDVVKPIAKLVLPPLVYGGAAILDKYHDNYVPDMIFPWKWSLSGLFSGVKNTFDGVATNDSTYVRNEEVALDDIANLNDSTDVDIDNVATGGNNADKSEVVDKNSPNVNLDDLGDDYSSSSTQLPALLNQNSQPTQSSQPVQSTLATDDRLSYLKARQDSAEAVLSYVRFARMPEEELSTYGIDKSDLDVIRPLRGKDQRDRIFDWYWHKYKK